MTPSGRTRVDAATPTVASLLRVIPDDADAFDAIVRRLVDARDEATLDRLFVEAGYHGVSGVIDPLIGSSTTALAGLKAKAARRLAIEELWQAHLQGGLQQAVRVLTAAGIDACALKGPVLGRRLYAPEFVRHCMDIDLLVSPTAFPTASSALMAAGYVPEHGVSADYALRFSHHLGFTREGSAPLELHFRAYAGFGVTVEADLLLSRARSYEVASGTTVLVPSPEDEFIYLAAHAAGHSFCRLVWLYDLKLLLRRS